MLANKNVVKLDNTKVYHQIEKYLTKHSYNSGETEKAYRKDIQLFFKLMKDKEIQYLTREDAQITLDDFEDFIEKLYKAVDKEGNRIYTNTTINRKVAAIKGVVKYLAGKKLVDDVSYMGLIESLPETSNSYGVLEAHEVFKMADLAWETEREKGDIKRLVILFALDTCIRKTALLNIKWSNFVEREDGVLVQVVDKGNKEFRQLISHDFYKELLTIKNGSDKVFNLSSDALNDTMKRLITLMKIPSKRNIVFHSIRKAGVTYRYRLTGDLLEAQRAANHSNVATTQLYLQSENYGLIGAVSGTGKIDNEMYKKVDHEVLVKAIEQCKKDMQLILNMKIQEILKQNN